MEKHWLYPCTLNSNLILLILAAAAVSLAFVASLNSNLILLILHFLKQRLNRIMSLNSNLILLIRNSGDWNSGNRNSFKFQSDSINTLLCCKLFTYKRYLNSNLILLILKGIAAAAIEGVKFKFQSDSINTIMALQYRDRVVQI